jgi:hypothetical protein
VNTTAKPRHAAKAASPDMRAQPMLDGRNADSARRRRRVITALDRAAADGTEISAAGIARAAGVDRTFLYRHRDLLEKIHALQAEPVTGDGTGPAVTRASLQADLLAAHERAVRLSTRIQHLEKRLSEALGDQAWRESGLGAPADIDALSQKITSLERPGCRRRQAGLLLACWRFVGGTGLQSAAACGSDWPGMASGKFAAAPCASHGRARFVSRWCPQALLT